MKMRTKDFRVRAGDAVDLKKWPTPIAPVYDSKREYRERLDEHVARLSSLQELLYASNRHAVLVIFQAKRPATSQNAAG